MSHLTRAAALLAAGLLGFLFVRTVAGSIEFPFMGLDHSNNAVTWASRPVKNVGSTTCADCHASVSSAWQVSAHVAVPCEDCHGAAAAHVEDGATLPPAPNLCANCHAALPSRPSAFPQIKLFEHGGGSINCTSCHDPHSPALGAPDITHQVQGREDCVACHGPDGQRPMPANHEGRPSQVCLGCHKAKGSES